MKKIILVSLILLLFCCNAIADDNYIIIGDTVYINDSKVYLSATPHTLSSSGWVYFNLTSKVYTGNIDACWGFNTSASKPKKAEVYSPHWVNTTTNYEKTFYNPSFIAYTGDDLDYGNSYNTNYRYTITESVINDNGTTYITSNAAFDSYTTDGTNYTIYWYTRHDNYYLWKDFSSSFNSVIHDYKGYNKWYYIKNVPISSNKEYTVRAWIDVPISTKKQSGKYYFAIKPSGETISQAVNNGHFYNLDPWWNATWSNRKNITLTGNTSGAQTDYQLLLNVTYDNDMQSDFDDLRFCNETHKLDSWLESKVDSSYALVWVEFPTSPANGETQNYWMYYGNAGAASNWDGNATFMFFDSFEYIDSPNQHGWSIIGGAPATSTDQLVHGNRSLKVIGTTPDRMCRSRSGSQIIEYSFYDPSASSTAQHYVYFTGGAGTYNTDATIGFNGYGALSDTEYMYHKGGVITNFGTKSVGWHTVKLVYDGTNINIWWDNIHRYVDGGYALGQIFIYSSQWQTCYYDDIRVRKYATNPPTYAFGSESYYVDSIHYNSSNPYNHTIQSDGTIIVNRTITTADDINWTGVALTDDCNLVVTEYNLTKPIIANFTLYNATLDWLKVTNLTVGMEYRLTNNTVYEEHIADASGEINFTNNLIPDDYQIILESIVNITCYSVYPETLFTNYTGLLSGSYIVESNYPLNMSSLAYLMGTNYTLTDDYHSYLKVPPNDIADDGIYRAHNRNTTPYMHWENNDTITEGNVWKWGGGTNEDFWITNESINATHTWINITGIASNVFPSMFYLGRLAMYESSKTGVEINKRQGVIFKIWDLEQLRDRNSDFWVRMFFDTQIESTPSEKIDIWFCNNSFNPISDDPINCEYCLRLDTWSSSRWLDHEDYQPHNNVSYSKPLIYYAGEPLEIYPDDINYVYLTSNTQSSKSYILNITNSDPEICNLTYAQTQTMWLRDEVVETNTPYAYTPSFFMATVRDYLEFTHHLYIADNQDMWAHSGYCTVPIGISNVLPTHCRYNYFWWDNTTDYYMNGSYDQSFWVNLTYGVDPDNGEPLTHVLLLYDDDYNFIAFVNSSLTGNQTDVDIWFDITDYKADNRLFMLKIVSTDNEGSTSVSWSSIFELPADNTYYRTIEIIKDFPSTISNILTSFLSYLPLFVGILISGFLILVCVGVFSKLKQW